MIWTLTIVMLVVALAERIAVVAGRRRWSRLTRQLHAGLETGGALPGPAVVDFQELASLPVPVQRYFRVALTDGQPRIQRVQVRHRGLLNLSPEGERWRPFVSEQVIVSRPPGFV